MQKVLYIGFEDVYADFFKSCCPPAISFQHWRVPMEQIGVVEFLKESGSLVVVEKDHEETLYDIKDRLISCRGACTFCLFGHCAKAKGDWEGMGIQYVFSKHWTREKLQSQFLEILGNEVITKPTIDISQREKEVLELIAQGFSTIEIADTLFLSIHTINTHRKAILKKFQAKTPADLVVKAIRFGVLSV